MSKEKKSGHRKHQLEKLLLATAILELISTIIDLIVKLFE